MKPRWLDVLPVYGLRYHAAWLFVCYISFIFIVLLLSYGTVESWIYRNDSLSARQQDFAVSLLEPLRRLRLDGPFLRWRKDLRNVDWLWLKYRPGALPHPAKARYKDGSELLFYYSEQQPLRVLLVGDSLAESVRMSLSPLFSTISAVDLKSNGVVSSTLTNKHFIDWPWTLRDLLTQRHYDVVLVFIGANSCQAVRNDDGSVVGYGSAVWPEAYGDKIREFIRIIKGQGASAWWLMNPPMRKEGYRQCMDSIGQIQREVATGMADEIIETADIVSAEDGSYTQSKVIDGKLYSLRTKDGVHFTMEGSRLISEEILRRIYQQYKIYREQPDSE
ncbi:DUF459 domain-containing protein [Candidatus Haliotispira prima]|uniref:DUF459 domain-containing protein n=1 Tax=Candidatus Haliotispira prima TaxID=3034016 RepID=A0ABY8MJM6_9SPIO|nr:DUF459 domain-containing protein [Candidatus Haliotispira prima]